MRDLEKSPLTPDLLRRMDAYWRAANYLSVGQIYLLDNPLLTRAAEARAHQAAPARPLGHDAGPELHLRPPEPRHQGARPEHDLHHRPGPRRPGLVANTYLEGTYSEVYPNISQDDEGMKRLFKQFSFPGGIPSHVAPETPGSIHEGGELGYSLSHAYRRGVRQSRSARRLRRRRRRGGDRPAGHQLALEQVPEPGPRRRGAADPASERLQDRQPHRAGAHSATRSSTRLLPGYGYTPYFVEGDDPDGDAPADGRHARHASFAEIAEHSSRRAQRRLQRAAALADDRPAHAQRAGPARRRWTASRSKARSARTRCRSPTWHEARAPEDARSSG